MKDSYMTYAVRGMGVGFPVTLACMTLIGGFNSTIKEFLLWMIASMCYGLITGFAFDQKKEWSLPAALIIHCFGCLIVTMIAGTVIGYADNFFTLLKGILPVFVIVYIIVYVLCFASMKVTERKINEALNRE